MKFSTQEEYGLRCLLRIAKSDSPNGLTIPEISQMEGLTSANVAKILRALRIGGFIDSARGQTGGYRLTRPPEEIIIGDVMNALGGRLFEAGFCDDHRGSEIICTNSIDCSIRSLWRTIQLLLDGVLSKTSLKDLLGTENQVGSMANNLAQKVEFKILNPNSN